MAMLEKFKEHKKEMEIKMEQAEKIADAAAEKFTGDLKTLVASATEEEFKEFIESESDAISDTDRMVAIMMFMETHEKNAGIIAMMVRK